MPSVISLTQVSGRVWSLKRTLYPTAWPSGVPSSLGDAHGHRSGGDSARLGVADHPASPPAQLEADLGQLGGLARAGLPAKDDHLVRRDQIGDFLAALDDRELVGEDRFGQGGQSPGAHFRGTIDLGGEPFHGFGGGRGAGIAVAQWRQARAQPVLVPLHAQRDARGERGDENSAGFHVNPSKSR